VGASQKRSLSLSIAVALHSSVAWPPAAGRRRSGAAGHRWIVWSPTSLRPHRPWSSRCRSGAAGRGMEIQPHRSWRSSHEKKRKMKNCPHHLRNMNRQPNQSSDLPSHRATHRERQKHTSAESRQRRTATLADGPTTKNVLKESRNGRSDHLHLTRGNSTNVLHEGLRIGEIGHRINSKVKSVKQGGYQK
jgi:hypothetical protein